MILGLTLVALALTIERLYLSHQQKRLRQAAQTFTFHKLRDELQALAISGELDTKSRLYTFLMTMVNIGVRNAATFRLSEMLTLGGQRSAEVPAVESEFVANVKLYSHDVQRFVGICFYEFSKMLLMNDPVFALGRVVASLAKISYRKALDSSYRVETHPLLCSIFPQQAQTLRKAAEYKAMGDDLTACAI